MAETVGQHSVAAFTSPVNGTTPIDANTVRGNDNTVRVAYVDHDADPGIHVQSSSYASRPVAGTVGRKWITVSSGRYQLWYDDGSRWHEVASDAINVDCLADANLTKGDVVKVTGFNNGQNLPTVNKVTASTDTAFGVVENTVTSGNIVQIVNTGLIEDVDTNGYAVGTILYPNSSGGWTSTKPTSGSYQPAAYVLRGNVNSGVLYVEFSAPRIVEASANTASTLVLRDSNGDFSAGTITATAVNATTLDLTNLEVTNIKAKDGTQAIAIADSTGATTFSANVTATLATAAQPNVTSVGTLTSLTVSGDLTVDTNTLKVDSANNRVGIGTTTLFGALNVAGGANGRLEFNPAAGGVNIEVLDSTRTNAADFGSYGKEFFWQTKPVAGSYSEKMRLDANGNLAVDTNTLYVDAANNRVGVGTASPGYALHVAGNAYVENIVVPSAGFGLGSGNSAFINLFGSTAGNPNIITFGTASTQRMELDASGNLGLGVTPSAWGSSFKAIQVGTLGAVVGGSSVVNVGFNYFFDGTNSKYLTSTNASLYQQTAGEHRFFSAPSGTAGNNVSFTQAMTLDADGGLVTDGGTGRGRFSFENGSSTNTLYSTTTNFGAYNTLRLQASDIQFYSGSSPTERARIDSSGNLLMGQAASFIGTNTADGADSSSLTISGGGGTTSARGAYVGMNGNESASPGNIEIASGNVAGSSLSLVARSTTSPMLFYTGGITERARITSGGEFLVNATATVNASIASVVGTASTNVLALKNGDNGNYFLYCASTANAERLRIEGDGDVYNLNGTYGTISDIRHKQDVIDAPSQWDDLKAIRFRKYRMKVEVETNPDAPYLLGVVAQELEQTSPGLVDEHPEYEEQEVTDEDGNVTTERMQVGTTKTVKSSILLMKAAVALQEAMARIEALEVEVAALKANA